MYNAEAEPEDAERTAVEEAIREGQDTVELLRRVCRWSEKAISIA
jgi:hypothetical protein